MSSTKPSYHRRYLQAGLLSLHLVPHFQEIYQDLKNRTSHHRNFWGFANDYRASVLGVRKNTINETKQIASQLVKDVQKTKDQNTAVEKVEESIGSHIKSKRTKSAVNLVINGFYSIIKKSMLEVVRFNKWETTSTDKEPTQYPQLMAYYKDGSDVVFYVYLHPHWARVDWAIIESMFFDWMGVEMRDYIHTISGGLTHLKRQFYNAFDGMYLEEINQAREHTYFGFQNGKLLELTPDDEVTFQYRDATPLDYLDQCFEFELDENHIEAIQKQTSSFAFWDQVAPPIEKFGFKYLIHHNCCVDGKLKNDDVESINQSIGLSLVKYANSNTLKSNKKAFYVYGKRDHGKTAFFDYLELTLGKSLLGSVDAENIFIKDNRFSLSPFHRKRIAYIKEVKQYHLNRNARTKIRNWAGKESTSLEHKGQDIIAGTRDYGRIWMDSNDPPPKGDAAFDKRLHCFHFRCHLPSLLKKEKKSVPSIEKEVSSGANVWIFLIALSGYQSLCQQVNKRVSFSTGHREVMELRKRIGGDILTKWMDYCLEIDDQEEKKYKTNLQALKDSYKVKILFHINNKIDSWQRIAKNNYQRNTNQEHRRDHPFHPIETTLDYLLDYPLNRDHKALANQIIQLGTTLEDEGFSSYTDDSDTTYFENIQLLKTAKQLIEEKIHQVESIAPAHDPKVKPIHSRVETGTFESWTLHQPPLEKPFDVDGKTAHLSYQQFCKDHSLKEPVLNHADWFQRMSDYKGRYEAYKTIQNGDVVFKQLDFKPYNYDQLQLQYNNDKSPF